MLVPLKWLQEYVELDKSPEELAELINAHILEIEAIHHPGKELSRLSIALGITEIVQLQIGDGYLFNEI